MAETLMIYARGSGNQTSGAHLCQHSCNRGRIPSSEVRNVLLEIAKPIALLLCILSLFAVFHTAFLVPGTSLEQKIVDSLKLLALAAGISLVSGMIFCESTTEPAGERLMATLPFQVFCWAAGSMFVLFIASWYLETYCVFYRAVQFPH